MKKNKLISGIFFFAFSVFVICTIYKADSGDKNIFFKILNNIKNGDKIGHFFVFGFLSFLLNIFWEKIYFKIIPVGSVVIFLLTILEEFSQKFFISRTFDLGDLLANFLGISFFSIVWLVFLKFKKNNNKS